MRESAAATPGDAVATSGERTGRWREGFPSFRTGLSVPLAIVIASRLFSVAVLSLVTYATGHAYPITEMDSGWYIGIATSGYHTGIVKGGHDLAFFPGWPLLIKFGTLGFLDPSFVAVFLANLISMIALVLVWFVLRQRLGERAARNGTLLLAFSPAAFVLALPYSEALFLLAVSLAFLAGSSRWRTLFSACAAIVRISGVPLLVATIVKAWTVHGAARRNLLLAAAAGGVALLAWMAWVAWFTGDPLGFLHNGSATWAGASGLADFVNLFTQPMHWWLRALLALRVVVVAAVAVGAVQVVRRDAELGAFALATVALVVLPGAKVYSDPRYVLVAFPAYAGLAERLGRKGTILVGVAFALLQVVMIAQAFPGGTVGRTPP
jgi:hypothetical protein